MKVILIFKPKGYGVNFKPIQYLRYAWFENTTSAPDIFTYTKGKLNWKRYLKFD